MQITSHEDIRINALINYLLKQDGISFDLTISGIKRPTFFFDIFYKSNNNLKPEKICKIGTFKGSFGFFFEYIYIEKFLIVYKIFNLKYIENVKTVKLFFDFLNNSNNFKQLFNKIPCRDLDDFYHKEFIKNSNNDKITFIDPYFIPEKTVNYKTYNFRGNQHKFLNPKLHFNFIHMFEIHPDGVIYPFPLIDINAFYNHYSFQLDLINNKIYF